MLKKLSSQNGEEAPRSTPARGAQPLQQSENVAVKGKPASNLATPQAPAETDPLTDPLDFSRTMHSPRSRSTFGQEPPLPSSPSGPRQAGARRTQSQGQAKTPPFTSGPLYTGADQNLHTPPPTGSSIPTRPLLPGVLLRNGRYRLQELLERQDWQEGVFEATWLGRDSQRGGPQIMMIEVALPDSTSVMTQSMLRTATMALANVGKHPHIPTLWDAFSDQGRSFFCFELVEGVSLMSYLRHNGRPLPENDVIECCLQMTEVLELLAHQSPPLVHGLIRPEHIVVGRSGMQFILTNFSIVLAGGATQFIQGMDRSQLSPYAAPEFSRGVIDVRSDLYSLIATAYHAATGHVPVGANGGVHPARRVNPQISLEFEAILSKGLRAVPNQRYQRPSELRQELLALRSVSGSLVSSRTTSFPGFSPQAQAQPLADAPINAVTPGLPIMMTALEEEEDQGLLLPRPEDLPPMREGNDLMGAVVLLSLIVIGFVLVAILSHVLTG